MSSSARSFGALAHYLATGRSGDKPERVGWSTSRNLPTDDPELAGKIMRATAAQNVRVTQPVYHLVLSFDPSDAADRAAMERVADRVIAALDLQGHQVLIVSHRDREHPHMHLLINRVHPETGLVWNRWRDRAVIQQVLREEELALGLRVVRGRLASRDPATVEYLPPERFATASKEEGDGRTPTPRKLNPRDQRPKVSRVDELAGHLHSYERIGELHRERYTVEVEGTAARTRLGQLEETIERGRLARGAFDRALARVYRDPTQAHDRFVATAQRDGISEATRLMREQPERFGALLSVERARAFGLLHAVDNTRARTAAITAALAGRNSLEASDAIPSAAATAYARRMESNVSHEFASLYEDPARARSAFERLVGERGSAEAVNRVRAHPEVIGEVRAAVRGDPNRVAAHVEQLAKAALDVTAAREMSTVIPAVRVDAQRELIASRAEAHQATERETTIRRELKAVPDRADLERRILGLLERLSPREVRQLRTILTAPQVAIAARLRGAVRDALLGREAIPEH